MMDNVRYVTYAADGTLDGCFLQVPPSDHIDRMIEIDEALAPTWVSYSANEARDGLELLSAPAPVPPSVPRQVTMRQARLALLGAGVLGNVAAAIDELESPHRETAQIEWEFSSTVDRDRPLVTMLGPKLGLTAEQLDQLFITAATL